MCDTTQEIHLPRMGGDVVYLLRSEELFEKEENLSMYSDYL